MLLKVHEVAQPLAYLGMLAPMHQIRMKTARTRGELFDE
jgi:hypothetical protein